MQSRHPHADLIKQWADGAKIQYLNHDNKWCDCSESPGWFPSNKYRVKPPTGKYRVSLFASPPLTIEWCSDKSNIKPYIAHTQEIAEMYEKRPDLCVG